MTGKIRIIAIAALFLIACGKETPKKAGLLAVSFRINEAVGDVQPSYQTVVWLETEEGGYVKTLFISEYLSYGGYNDSTICPAWIKQADWEHAPETEYDARTQATPSTGEHSLIFDLGNEDIPPGPYIVCMQIHIIEDYNILYKGRVVIGGDDNETRAQSVYTPAPYEAAKNILTDVNFKFMK